MTTPQDQSEKIVQAQIDIAVLKKQLEPLERAIEELRKGQEEIKSALGQAKGGWRMLMLMGGAAATLGAFLSYFLERFHWRL